MDHDESKRPHDGVQVDKAESGDDALRADQTQLNLSSGSNASSNAHSAIFENDASIILPSGASSASSAIFEADASLVNPSPSSSSSVVIKSESEDSDYENDDAPSKSQSASTQPKSSLQEEEPILANFATEPSSSPFDSSLSDSIISEANVDASASEQPVPLNQENVVLATQILHNYVTAEPRPDDIQMQTEQRLIDSMLQHHLEPAPLLRSLDKDLTSTTDNHMQVHEGSLPNGLNYVVSNHKHAGDTVQLRLVIKVGSMVETSSERGFAHLLERVAFKRTSGTAPHAKVEKLLNKENLTLMPGVVSSTTFETTTFDLILPVTPAAPSASASASTPALDTGVENALSLLAHWSCRLAIGQDHFNACKADLLNALAKSSIPHRTEVSRFLSQTPYADRNPLGCAASIEKATLAALRAFHAKWYMPARMTLLVVGNNVNVSALESVIKRVFTMNATAEAKAAAMLENVRKLRESEAKDETGIIPNSAEESVPAVVITTPLSLSSLSTSESKKPDGEEKKDDSSNTTSYLTLLIGAAESKRKLRLLHEQQQRREIRAQRAVQQQQHSSAEGSKQEEEGEGKKEEDPFAKEDESYNVLMGRKKAAPMETVQNELKALFASIIGDRLVEVAAKSGVEIGALLGPGLSEGFAKAQMRLDMTEIAYVYNKGQASEHLETLLLLLQAMKESGSLVAGEYLASISNVYEQSLWSFQQQSKSWMDALTHAVLHNYTLPSMSEWRANHAAFRSMTLEQFEALYRDWMALDFASLIACHVNQHTPFSSFDSGSVSNLLSSSSLYGPPAAITEDSVTEIVSRVKSLTPSQALEELKLKGVELSPPSPPESALDIVKAGMPQELEPVPYTPVEVKEAGVWKYVLDNGVEVTLRHQPHQSDLSLSACADSLGRAFYRKESAKIKDEYQDMFYWSSLLSDVFVPLALGMGGMSREVLSLVASKARIQQHKQLPDALPLKTEIGLLGRSLSSSCPSLEQSPESLEVLLRLVHLMFVHHQQQIEQLGQGKSVEPSADMQRVYESLVMALSRSKPAVHDVVARRMYGEGEVRDILNGPQPKVASMLAVEMALPAFFQSFAQPKEFQFVLCGASMDNEAQRQRVMQLCATFLGTIPTGSSSSNSTTAAPAYVAMLSHLTPAMMETSSKIREDIVSKAGSKMALDHGEFLDGSLLGHRAHLVLTCPLQGNNSAAEMRVLSVACQLLSSRLTALFSDKLVDIAGLNVQTVWPLGEDVTGRFCVSVSCPPAALKTVNEAVKLIEQTVRALVTVEQKEDDVAAAIKSEEGEQEQPVYAKDVLEVMQRATQPDHRITLRLVPAAQRDKFACVKCGKMIPLRGATACPEGCNTTLYCSPQCGAQHFARHQSSCPVYASKPKPKPVAKPKAVAQPKAKPAAKPTASASASSVAPVTTTTKTTTTTTATTTSVASSLSSRLSALKSGDESKTNTTRHLLEKLQKPTTPTASSPASNVEAKTVDKKAAVSSPEAAPEEEATTTKAEAKPAFKRKGKKGTKVSPSSAAPFFLGGLGLVACAVGVVAALARRNK